MTELNKLQIQGLMEPRRKLHRAHFAFMRAYVQGVDERSSWDRYLNIEGRPTDLRVVKKTVAWLRDEFAAAARRHDRHGLARLVRFDVSRIVQPSPEIPTLEEFAIERGLEDFSESEQVEAYQAEFGHNDSSQNRRAHLIKRQLEALHWLEKLAAEEPHAADPVSAWLHPDLSARLEAAGLHTLRQLAERINGVGRGWHASVRAIGTGKASRIVEWMQANEPSTGLLISPRAWLKGEEAAGVPMDLPNASGIVPFERLVVSHDLDGSAGRFRAPQYECMISARNDHQAVLSFIRAQRGLTHVGAIALSQATTSKGNDLFAWRKGLSNTQRAYLTELERFTLWAILQRKEALSSLTFEDCIAYSEFIANPTPEELWCGTRSRRRTGPAWRPFAGPMAASSQTRALAVLSAFYRFLHEKRYLTGNPMSGVSKPKAARKTKVLERVLTLEQWNSVSLALKELPPTSANLRLRFAIRLLYATGLRRQELLRATVGNLKLVTLPGSPHGEPVSGWELRVVGKGGAERDVAVPQGLVRELSSYLRSRGLNPDPLAPENRDVALIGQATDIASRAPWSKAAATPPDPGRPIGAQTFYDQLKAFFNAHAATLAQTDAVSAEVFRSASTHWLRHTRISHSLAAGTELHIEMKNAGHKSPETTAIYTHIEARERIVGNAAFFNTFNDREATA